MVNDSYTVVAVAADGEQGSEYINALVMGVDGPRVYQAHDTTKRFCVGRELSIVDLDENPGPGLNYVKRITDPQELSDIARDNAWDL